MSFASGLALAASGVLVCAVSVLWLTTVGSVIRAVAVQGTALGGVALILGVHDHDEGLVATALVVLALKGGVIPVLLGRSGRPDGAVRESRPLVNVPASLVAAGGLIVVALVTTRGLAHFVGTRTGMLVPIGVATLLLGFFVLVTRRRPVFQIVGLVMVDNGTALSAFLLTAGVPFLIELGVSLDIFLGVVMLMVLTRRLHAEFGDVDLDELQELRD
jgi:hydrogenase-4 component E